jgi:ribosomal peptide maturation radical SAM protein 1
MTVPSVCLARRLKQDYPHLTVIMGGSNTAGPMGVEIARQFPEIDYVMRGECDETLPRLVRCLIDGRPVPDLPGLVRRVTGTDLVEAIPPAPVQDLSALPYPDFDDFVEVAMAAGFSERFRTNLQLPFESSRGCWWGERHHCRFCGINAEAMVFRRKPAERIRDELDALVSRYRPHLLVATDSILDHRYFETLLPDLARRPLGVGLSYETKSNLRRQQVHTLAEAGVVELWPGIEALSTRLLRLIDKGTTALDNLLCLRLAEEHGLRVNWYHLCGLPAERVEDYEREVALIRLVHHLPPPREIARFTLQRFSPYFDHPGEHGIADPRAFRVYRSVYPFADEVLDRLAYHFEFRHVDGRGAGDTCIIEEMLDGAVADWRAAYGRVRLDALPVVDGLMLVDTRREPAVVFALDGDGARVYRLLDTPASAADLLRRLDSDEGPCSGPPLGPVSEAVVSPDRVRRAAAAHAQTLNASLVSIPFPTRPMTGATDRERLGAVGRLLDQLALAGLIYTEGARSLALAVRRTEASAGARPVGLEVAAP